MTTPLVESYCLCHCYYIIIAIIMCPSSPIIIVIIIITKPIMGSLLHLINLGNLGIATHYEASQDMFGHLIA